MGVIRKYWQDINETKGFQDNKLPLPLLTFRKNRNLRSYLVKAKLKRLKASGVW